MYGMELSVLLPLLGGVAVHAAKPFFPADIAAALHAARAPRLLVTTPVHLRMCLGCGNVACCDSSAGRHASRHFKESGHPVMRSIEPGEEWRWCYVDDLLG